MGEDGCDDHRDDLTRRYTRTNVGTVCIERFLASCPLMTCTPNQGVLLRLTTAAHRTTPSTCIRVEISGPLTSGQASACEALADGDCSRGLARALRECVPITGTTELPKDCPICPERACDHGGDAFASRTRRSRESRTRTVHAPLRRMTLRIHRITIDFWNTLRDARDAR